MTTAERRVVWAGALGVLALTVWGCFGITSHAIVALDRIGDAATSLTVATAKLNSRTGTLSMLNEDLGAAKSAIVHADLIARHEQQQLTTLDQQERTLFADLHETTRALHGSLDAATQAAQDASAAVKTMNDTIGKAQPLLEASTATVRHADALVSDPATQGLPARIYTLAGHLDGTLGHVEGITADSQRIADDLTRKYFTPTPWWKKPGQLLDLTWRAYMAAK